MLLLAILVLIETYWNVKKSKALCQSRHAGVLIETYWNVKAILELWNMNEETSINRNILECKGIHAEDKVGF